MFFERPQEKEFTIDGITYEMTNESKTAFWNSKLQLLDLLRQVKEIAESNSSIDENSYVAEKKALVNHLKAFEKNYNKHKTKTHVEFNGFIQKAFIPLVNILEANFEFHKIEELMKKDETIPDFRYNALEAEFCKHCEALLTILTNHGKLRQEFNIQRMLDLLKLENWQENIPVHFFLQPLKDSIIAYREELLQMRARGLILCKYRMEENEEMQDLVLKMVSNDVICQWLIGNELKRDQLCFLYKVLEILYDSPARKHLLEGDKALWEQTIPALTAFETILMMCRFITNKDAYEKKMKKLAQPILAVDDEPQEVQKKVEGEEAPAQPEEPEISEEEKEAKEKEEREMFGRYWMWENYYSDQKKPLWDDMAHLMTKVNRHVIEQMRDHIIMKHFKLKKKADIEKMYKEIQDMKQVKDEDNMYRTMADMKNRQKRDTFQEEETKRFDEDKTKRLFCDTMRPPYFWNFYAEDEEPIEHLINPSADPEECYKFERENNRVTKLLDACEDLGINL